MVMVHRLHAFRRAVLLVLCDATDETSLIDMLYCDNKAGGFVSAVSKTIVSIF
jgi:hypothetical protein